MMPLVLSILVAVIVTGVWITANVVRYRNDVWHHWYNVGARDGEHNDMWYGIQHQKNAFIVNAYMQGFNDGRNKTWQ